MTHVYFNMHQSFFFWPHPTFSLDAKVYVPCVGYLLIPSKIVIGLWVLQQKILQIRVQARHHRDASSLFGNVLLPLAACL